MNYFWHLGIFAGLYIMLAVGLNILVGYCGRLSLAHVVFFAVGAYSYAYGGLVLSWGFWASVFLGLIVTSALSGLFVLASHARQGDEYVLISLAIQSLCYSIFSNWYNSKGMFGSLGGFTNGPFGVAGLPKPWWARHSILQMFLCVSIVCALTVSWTAWALAGPWGRTLKALRDNEKVAENLQKNSLRLHFEAVLLASMLASIAGALYAAYVSYIDPGLCNLDQAVLVLSMVIIGGVGNLRGPIIGALLLVGMPEVLKVFHLPNSSIDNIRLLIYGLALTILVHIRPQGIAGLGGTDE